MSHYINEMTGLPKPSYDLWEEVFFTSTYTTATVYGALVAASELAEAAGDQNSAVLWRAAADDISLNAKKHLYNPQRQAFYKGLYVSGGVVSYDTSLDFSSVYGAFAFGLFPIDSHEVTTSIETISGQLKMPQDGFFGITRHENDLYCRVSDQIEGNPWFITSLWLSQYYHRTGNQPYARRIVDWCRRSMLNSGVLSEQVDPYSGHFVSVAPLTWSHAEYISTLIDFTEKTT